MKFTVFQKLKNYLLFLNRKRFVFGLAVLVLVGSMFLPGKAAAAQYDDVSALLTLNNYKIDPTDEVATIQLQIGIYGDPAGKLVDFGGGLFNRADQVDIAHMLPLTGGDYRLKGYFVGLSESNKTNWNCKTYSGVAEDQEGTPLPNSDPISLSNCSFIGVSEFIQSNSENKPVSITFNPSTVSETPSGARDNLNFSVVPVVVLQSGVRTYAYYVLDGNLYNRSFFVEWDEAVGSPQIVSTKAPLSVSGVGSVPGTDFGGGLNTLGGVLFSIVNIILSIISGLVQLILAILNSVLLYPILRALLDGGSPLNASTIPLFVKDGWVYTRDLMNLFFILVLIFSAIALMLRVEGYGFKHTIGRVVMIALVVNFSLLAGEIILNFSQIMMSAFISSHTIDDLSRSVNAVTRSNIFGGSTGDALRGTALLLFQIIYEIGVFCVLAALAALLLIRVVALWLLLIIAPIAYVLSISHQGEHYLKDWWDKFLAYAFFAPIMAFVIGIAARLVQSQFFMNQNLAGSGGIAAATSGMIQGVVVLVILAYGLKVASKMSIAGADTVTGAAESAWKGASKWTAGLPAMGGAAAAKMGAGFVRRKWKDGWTAWAGYTDKEGKKSKFRETVFAALNIPSTVKGWQMRSQELEHRSDERATARGREITTKFRTRGKLDIPYTEFVKRKHMQEDIKEYAQMSKEMKMKKATEMLDWKGHEAAEQRLHLFASAASVGQWDDLLSAPALAVRYADKDGSFDSATAKQRMVRDFLKDKTGDPNGHIDEFAMSVLAEDFDNYAVDTKHPEYMGHAKKDSFTGKSKWGMETVGEAETLTRNGLTIQYQDYDADEGSWFFDHSIGEWKKKGGRERIGLSPHGHNVLTVPVDLDGNILDNDLEKGGKPIDITVAHKLGVVHTTRKDGRISAYEKAYVRDLLDGSAQSEGQHIPARSTDWEFGTDEKGESTIRHEGPHGVWYAPSLAYFEKVRQKWDLQPNIIKLEYLKRFGLQKGDLKKMHGLKVILPDGTERIIGKDKNEFNINEDEGPTLPSTPPAP